MFTRDTMFIDPPFAARLAAAGLDSVQRVLACEGDHLAAWSRSSDTVRKELPGGPGAVYIKRYHYARVSRRLRAFFRGGFFGASRARSEYRNLARMRKVGIHAVRPIAWGERRVLHTLRSCFLITEAVPDAISLASFVQNFAHRPLRGSRIRARHELLRCLADEIRRMHEAGFIHRDLFWRNVLIRPLEGEGFEFYVLDASVGRRVRLPWLRRQKIVHDLAALSVLAPDFCTRADQLRFMLTYLGLRELSDADRAWLLDVQKHWSDYRDVETTRFRRGRVFDAIPAPARA